MRHQQHTIRSRGFKRQFGRTAQRRALRRRYFCELLEQRQLLSVTIAGIPNWVEQGARPINNGQLNAAPNNAAGGAIQSVAVNPTNAQNLIIGTANGGVWRTTNADPNNPGLITWTPLTDQFGSLSVASVAFSPLDANVIYAGTGQFSNGIDGGEPIGVLKSTDGGTTWSLLGNAQLAGRRLKEILPTSIDLDAGPGVQQVVFAATINGSGRDSDGSRDPRLRGGGLFRSTDGGVNWNQVVGASATDLPAGAVASIIGDPNDNQRFYAGVLGQGVYRTSDGGVTWTPVNTNLTNLGTSSVVELTAMDDGATTVLYVAIANGNTLNGVWRSTDNGGNWTPLAAGPTGFSAGASFNEKVQLKADPTINNVVYIAGQGGGAPIWRYNPAGAGSWVQIAGQGNAQGNTTPHADSRDLEFLNNTTLIETDDGGIYYLDVPTDALNHSWRSFNGQLGAIEFYSVAYDIGDQLLFGGSQDNGSEVQTAPGSTVWNRFLGGDGQTQAYDALGDVRYSLSNGFGGFIHNGSQLLMGANATDVAITGATNANPIVITSNNHGLNNGQGVFVRGVLGNTAANGIFVITRIDANTFSLNGSQGNGAYGGGGTWRLIGLNAADLGFAVSGSFNNFLPVVTNPVLANAMMFGRSGVYESFNQGDVIADLSANLPGFTGGNTALAYGGRRAGLNFSNVAYVGDSSGRLWFRGEAGAAFTRISGAGGGRIPETNGSVTDIVMDPQDWRRVYVLAGVSVWVSNDVTNLAANPFVDITGNLAGDAGDLTTQLRSIELVDNTPLVAGDGVVVTGGLGGVFRRLGNFWSEFGGNLPNALVDDVRYIAGASDLLIAGTFGRGAWTIATASASIAVTSVLQIVGDADFAGEDDNIRLVRNAANPTLLDVFLNGLFSQYLLSNIQQINVSGLGGNDTLILDSTNGLISVANGTRFDGGTGFDLLRLEQTGGAAQAADSYEVGPSTGDGVSTISGATGLQRVQFENLEPVIDLVPAATLNILATPEDNAISYTGGGVLANGKVLIDSYESIEFSNKVRVVIDASFGNDTMNLSNATTPTGLTEVAVLAGDGDDVVTVNTGTAVAVEFNGGAGHDLLDASGASGGAELIGGDGNDTMTGGTGNDTLTGGNGDDLLNPRGGTNTVTGGSGTDILLVAGTDSDDTITVSHVAAVVNVTVNATVAANTISTMENLRIEAGNGFDTITITPSATNGLSYTVFGGDPAGATGDTLKIDTPLGMTFTPGPDGDSGSIVVFSAPSTNISYDEIEALTITGSSVLNFDGTNGDDAITIEAISSGGADGVQDFRATLNDSAPMVFINVPAVQIFARGGSDTITIIMPAPSGADWDVNVLVDAGPPSAASDLLVVQTPAAGTETVTFTPTAPDQGNMQIVQAGGLATATNISGIDLEKVIYDGGADPDSLTIVATGLADTIVHTPGATDNEGLFQVNGLLPIAYQNLGAAAVLTVDGGGGTDTFICNGTNANDVFNVAATPTTTLNSRLAVNTLNVETLTLEGFAGDDTFNLVPSVASSPYGVINFNGGGQASALGDRANLIGSAGDDGFNLSGQSVNVGTRTINGSGVENISLALGGGTDTINYTGVAAVVDAIEIVGSTVGGAGQIRIPGVAGYSFTGAELMNAAGNAGDGDSLTFTGTDDPELYQIDTEALGTPADPVLLFQNAGGTTLLTLAGYTGFATLNVKGLDGADTFNVFTGPARGRDVFIDGGAPTAKKKSTDKLFVYYSGQRPKIIQSTATQTPRTGLVDLNYGTSRSVIKYADVEDVIITK